MPKSIVVSNAVLLLCLSALAGLGLPVLLGGGHPLATNACIVWAFALVALGTGLIMLVTELFSGHRWIALSAFASAMVGMGWLWRTGLESAVAEWAWIVSLFAAVLWFAVLASVARANR